MPRGFLLRRTPSLPRWIPKEVRAVRDTFLPWYHTVAEIETVFGRPEGEDGWGQALEWRYSSTDDGTNIVFDFDFGLLREILATEGQAKSWNPSAE